MTATVQDTALQTKLPLSAVFITLNAASQLGEALQSVDFCEDLVVVDSGSTDGTVELAQAHGARVFQHDWAGFGPQKQFAVSLAQFDWVLCLDADERISPELRSSIRYALGAAHKVSGFDMPRCNYFLGRYLRHGEGYPDYSRRLFNRQHAQWSHDRVHEKVQATNPGAVFQRLQGDIIHDSAETLSNYLSKQNRYTSIQAEGLAQSGKWPGVAKLALSPLVRFIKFYVVRQGFRDGWAGFVHISIGCFNSFMKYAKTRELMIRNRGK